MIDVIQWVQVSIKLQSVNIAIMLAERQIMQGNLWSHWGKMADIHETDFGLTEVSTPEQAICGMTR